MTPANIAEELEHMAMRIDEFGLRMRGRRIAYADFKRIARAQATLERNSRGLRAFAEARAYEDMRAKSVEDSE